MVKYTEIEFVNWLRRQTRRGRGLVLGIGDDCAIVRGPAGEDWLFTTDMLIEGVHFDRAFTPPTAIGHRALAVNLSDLAAMGAEPRLALLSLALPLAFAVADFDAMIGALAALAAQHRLHVAGGNLTRSPGPLVVDVTVMGTLKPRRALRRVGARPGDELYVSGTIGAAAAGLQMLQAGLESRPATQRYLYPEPRVRLGSLLGRNRAASACMDLSDGLADAVRQIASASGVGAMIDIDAVPIDPDARAWFVSRGLDPVHAAITGGDDYELLVAVRPRTRGRLAAAQRHGGVPLTRIGLCTGDRAVLARRTVGGAVTEAQPMPRGYSHFR